MSTTSELFGAYQRQYDYFNARLFGGELPECVLNFSRKCATTLGFFAPKRWEQASLVRHEISLNPSTLKLRTQEEISATLVHEMVHLWQQEFGKPSKRGYHNAEWGKKMESVGLMPSNTGAPGGKKTGVQMAHYVIEGGRFALDFADMPRQFILPWISFDFSSEAKSSKPSRVKYHCIGCEANVWGKRELSILCNTCGCSFDEVAPA
jgi:predicted SprT family Zn-dependent metalloprotease